MITDKLKLCFMPEERHYCCRSSVAAAFQNNMRT